MKILHHVQFQVDRVEKFTLVDTEPAAVQRYYTREGCDVMYTSLVYLYVMSNSLPQFLYFLAFSSIPLYSSVLYSYVDQ